ncbi:hypothetical protein OAB00_01330 [Akkermansiaceae bacterium]|nr:hypothetical protein [Akkermansiaceae bacterium]
MRNKDIIYDIEVYSNIFTFTAYNVSKGRNIIYEISERRNDFHKLILFLKILQEKEYFLVGFNNYGYDYPIIHELMKLANQYGPHLHGWRKICKVARAKSDQIINAPFEARFTHIIWGKQQWVKQIDLYKIHHFDNVARATSLKMLEFNMRSEDIQELPFDPNQPVSVDDMDRLIEYNEFDVKQTYAFYLHTLDHIDLRVKLSEKYGHDFMNANDTKIGKTIFQLSLEKKLGDDICFLQGPDGRIIRQTKRKQIDMSEIVQDIPFKRPEFQAVRNWIVKQRLKGETKDVFTNLDVNTLDDLEFYCELFDVKKEGDKPKVKNLNCVIDGFKYVFGTGGLHACVHGTTVASDKDYIVIDLDVVSYYPSLAIVNNIFPKHLGKEFCTIYSDLKKQRVSYKKGTPENAALKLALNGVYGDSNNKYSPFYDPQYTMAITVNGQLLLCLLCEWLYDIEGLKMVQANTDGITVRLLRTQMSQLEAICKKWEEFTKLELESAEYSRMFIRDVNNYIAEYSQKDKDGNHLVKRKGAYEYDIGWHQNHSALVIQKAAEAHALHGADISDFIHNHDDPFDFYLRTKIPKSSKLEIETVINGGKIFVQRLQNITRYYVSYSGGSLVKTMPPLPKKPDKERRFAIQKGFLVTVHNQVKELTDVNYDYYIDEATKLVNHFKN